jgi:hypothetical protein
MPVSTIQNASLASGVPSASNITTGTLPKAQLPAGSVLQVVSTTKTDTFSMTGLTFTSVTGLTASITPTSATSKILVIVSMTCGLSSDSVVFTRLMRGGTAIDIGDAAGSRTQSTAATYTGGSASVVYQLLPQNMNFLDSPSTTSSTTYGVQIKGEDGGVSVFVNRASNDSDFPGRARTASTITLMEIAA